MNQKRCIFHIPNTIDPNGTSGSQVRPMKMKEAFERIGYEVEMIIGLNRQRKLAINRIKKKIKDGVKYDFLYSESSTMPTLLTDPGHLPTHPFMDFGIMRFCRKNGIRVGLFYRDIHWKFPDYRKAVPWYQKAITIPMYWYDLHMYNRCLDKLFLTCDRVQEHVRKNIKPVVESLPPGTVCDEQIIGSRQQYFSQGRKDKLRLFYVGGLSTGGGLYDLIMPLRVLKDKEDVEITLCCRKQEWENLKEEYAPYLSERVKIIHKSGTELKDYYLNCDISMCYFRHTVYRHMAMPIKTFECLGYTTPNIETEGTASGEFVEKNGIGWSIPYEEKAFSELLDRLVDNYSEIVDKSRNAAECLPKNTWESRAKQVAQSLSR